LSVLSPLKMYARKSELIYTVSGGLKTLLSSVQQMAKDDRKNNSLLHLGFLSIQGAVPPDLSRHHGEPFLRDTMQSREKFAK
jgi:hypothetical protein